MQTEPIEQVTRHVFGATRRRIAGALGGLALAPLLGPVFAEAKKTKKKKKTLCLNGQTVQASGKKVKKLTKQGATPGSCASCVPQCNGASCGGSDGCGGTCGCNAGSVCHEGACTKCTVTCLGTPQGCGSLLIQALVDGGTIVACPGRYSGLFVATSAITLIGAGSGDDPATSTILDGGGTARTLQVVGAFKLSLTGVRVAGGSATSDGGGLLSPSSSDVRIDACAFVGNTTTTVGGGIAASGKLSVNNSLFANNTAGSNSGAISLGIEGPYFITDCTLSGNTAAGNGGAIRFELDNLTMTGSTVQGNTANRGGGIYIGSDGALKLDSATTITGNTAREAGRGGGVYGGGAPPGAVQRNGATISGNTPADSQCIAPGC